MPHSDLLAWLSSATLRLFSLAEQGHTQNFYLRCFKLDFDAVKTKVGLLIEYRLRSSPKNEDNLKNEEKLKNKMT